MADKKKGFGPFLFFHCIGNHMKLILATLALTTCAAHAQQAPLTDEQWRAQQDQQSSRTQYIEDKFIEHSNEQIARAVHNQECSTQYPSAYGLTKKDCE
jgi:outer membrane biogenesis lipoprotein LolB